MDRITRDIDWSELSTAPLEVGKNHFLGSGSFGIVVKATWKCPGVPAMPVAVKVMMKSRSSEGGSGLNFERMYDAAVAEAELVERAHRSVMNKDLICQVHGIARGTLSTALLAAFPVAASDECVGIVMQFEAGGSLAGLAGLLKSSAPSTASSSSICAEIITKERIRLCCQISRGMRVAHIQNRSISFSAALFALLKSTFTITCCLVTCVQLPSFLFTALVFLA